MCADKNIRRKKMSFEVYSLLFYFLFLTGLEKQDRYLTEIKIDKVLCLMCHVGSEVSSNNTMPSRTVLLVELLLDVRRDVLLNIVLLQSLRSHIYSILLHILRHVGILYHCFSFTHFFKIDLMFDRRDFFSKLPFL